MTHTTFDAPHAGQAAIGRHTLMAGTALGLALAACAFSGVRAQEAPGGNPMTIPQIEVEAEGTADPNTMTHPVPLSRIPTSVQDTPQTVSVTTEQKMREQNLTDLRDVMLRTPGITMHAGEGGGSQPPGDSFNLRGFTTQNDIFVDGVRDIGIANRDTFNLESVQVFKGPSGSFFGRGSGGGSINMTTKRARLGETFAMLNAGIGTDNYYRGTADMNVPIAENAAFRLNLLGMDRDYAGRNVMTTQRIGIAPTLTVGLDEDTVLTLSYLHQKDDGVGDNGVPWYRGKPVTEFGVDRSNFYGFTDNFERSETDRISATIEHEFNPNLRIANTLQAAWYEIDRWNLTGPVGGTSLTALYPNGLDRNSVIQTLSGSHQSRGQESRAIQNQTSLGADFVTGPLRHELVASLDLSLENYDTQRYTMESLSGGPVAGPDLNVFDPAFTASGLRRVPARRDETDARSVAVSLYDRVEFLPGWFAIGNVRYERYEADTKFTNPDGTRAQPDGSTSQDLFTYQVALQYKPTEDQTYYIAHGVSQLPQYDAGLGYGEIMGATDNRDPQESESFEIGGKVSLLDGRLGLGAAVFQIQRDNEQIQDSLGNVTVANHRRRVRGVELQADGRITPEWTVSAGYAWLDSKTIRPGDPSHGGVLGKTPEHSGFVWTNYKVTPAFDVGAGIHYVDERYGSDGGDRTDGNRVPSQWQIDAAAGYQLTENFRLQLNVINVTDELTYDRIHTGRQAHPGLGRTFIVNTTLTF